MERTVQFLLGVSVCIALSACSRAHPSSVEAAQIRAKLDAIPLDQKVDLMNKEWLVILSPQQFYVMRRAGTELPSLSGNALDHHNGIYVCSACGNPLYSAETKFNSGTGWPSFWQPIRKKRFTKAACPRRSSEWKFRAPVADRISGMSSMTDRRQLDCATV
jgi:hypothetical protein